ncbi:hypothetical protein BMS3Abin15_00039 [bacterium BMS3Abin15]|nr:hypothetical protein BMS3Abin15_00039 [bacterium BMS3Abin15]
MKDRFEKEVVSILPESIKIVELPPGEKHQYNCFAYALDLHDDIEPFKDGFVYSSFVKYLLDKNELEKISEMPQKGDIVLYWNGNDLKHAGKVIDGDIVISKWSGGPLLEHSLLHVPVEYGDRIEYYRILSVSKIKQTLEQHKELNQP